MAECSLNLKKKNDLLTYYLWISLIFVHHQCLQWKAWKTAPLTVKNCQMQITRKLCQKNSFEEHEKRTSVCRFKITPATLNWKVYGYFARKLQIAFVKMNSTECTTFNVIWYNGRSGINEIPRSRGVQEERKYFRRQVETDCL